MQPKSWMFVQKKRGFFYYQSEADKHDHFFVLDYDDIFYRHLLFPLLNLFQLITLP